MLACKDGRLFVLAYYYDYILWCRFRGTTIVIPSNGLSQVKSSQVELSQAKSSQVEPSRAKSSQVEPSRAKLSQVEPSRAKLRQVEPS